jgi:3-isopropylmalate/(R)-2-methylmalate dehydratase large subunit
MVREAGLTVRYPERTFATINHITPTAFQLRPFSDTTAEEMTVALFGEGES